MLQLHWHLISSLWPPSSLLIQGIYIRFSLLFSMFCHSTTYIYWLPPQHLLPTSFLIVQFLLGYHVVLWRPTRPFRTNTPKRGPFHYRGLGCKSRKLRNTWGNRQIWPCNTELSRAKANRVLPRECTGHSKHPLPTTQEKTLYMDITRWSTPKSDWLYSLQPKMEKLYTVSKNKTRSWLWLRSWTPYCRIQT